MKPLQPCGTPAAARRHRRRKETLDRACLDAESTDRYQRRQKNPRPTIPTNTEIIDEVVFLLQCGEGEHAILKALNTTHTALHQRLYRAGRTDLNQRLFNHTDQMVWAA